MIRDFYSVPIYTADVSADALLDLQALQQPQGNGNPRIHEHQTAISIYAKFSRRLDTDS